ncbi:MAG TPA: ACP phosphodiesterase [Ferruginibacter sp.]|jgi:acyl carrier protein phosphodiesterase|nr:ACP phosphodiesterase [Ferruginibacter sp.]
MNLLAHAYLSFDQPEMLIGNMINDYVKGKKQFDYPHAVHKGMVLHRSIDDFTDTHPVTKQLKSFFKDDYRLYAGAFGDVAYDHFLANDTNQFADDEALKVFSTKVYKVLDDNFDLLPLPFQGMIPYMKKENWLYNYKSQQGIKNSFAGLVRRAAYLTDSDTAFDIFNRHYADIKICYDEFFPQLKLYAAEQFRQLS